MREVVMVSAKRSAIGSFGGVFKDVSAVELAAKVVSQMFEETEIDPDLIDEIIFGNVLSAGLGQNIARQIALTANIPTSKTAFTVNMVCGSGLKVFELASLKLMTGMADCILVGGTENMSQAPYLMHHQRWGHKMGHNEVTDSLLSDGLLDSFENVHMGLTAERLAEEYNITRERQDDYALNSQIKAEVAIQEHKFKEEIVPIPVIHPKTKEHVQVVQDQHPRFGMIMQQLKELNPVFSENGTITAGNASGLNDGAAAVLLMTRELAEQHNLPIMATIRAYADIGIEPKYMSTGPVYAIRKALEQAELEISDLDLIEINEAFAVQMIQNIQELNLPIERVNVNGGAIALGHPIGASGTRIVVSLVHEMLKRDSQFGLASACIGGGQGAALVLERK